MIDLRFSIRSRGGHRFAHSFTTFLILRACLDRHGRKSGAWALRWRWKSSPKLRGFLSGISRGICSGYPSGTVCFYFVFPRWGWRPMFFIGGLPALSDFLSDSAEKESEVWEKTGNELGNLRSRKSSRIGNCFSI